MKNILLQLGLILSGKNIFSEFYRLKSLEFNNLENNLEIQKQSLKEILLHAWQHVPYYTKILHDHDVVVNGVINLNNFNKIPILTKKIIRENFSELKSNDIGYSKRKPFQNTSGGSTGEPIKFIQDKKTWTTGMAGKWWFYSFITKYPCKMIKLWGSEKEFLSGNMGSKALIKNYFSQRLLLNTFRMSDLDMAKYVNKINLFHPAIIEAYVQSIYELSKFIIDNRLEVFSPKGIITSAGTLYPEMKMIIEKAFKTKVFNRYGSREVGDMACSCDKNEGLHLNIFQHYLEILNDKLEPCQPNELGKIYITTLDNFSMPLIRYDIGDIAIPTEKKYCSCGRGIPLIKSVNGRDNSIIKIESGCLDSTALTTSFYSFGSIKKYKLTQHDIKNFTLKLIILDKQKWQKDQPELLSKLKKILGNNVIIQIEIVDKIDSLANGKYQYITSEL